MYTIYLIQIKDLKY